jgi:glycosyltransferase involved in cell wall biosynthesis
LAQTMLAAPADADTSLRPPQVSIISHYYPPYPCGGAERQAQAIAESLAAQGWRMQVLTRHLKGMRKQELLNGVQVRRLWASTIPKTQSALLTFNLLYHLLLAPRGQIIHINQMYRDIVPALIARRLRGSPIVISLHGGGQGQYADVGRLLRKPDGRLMLRLSRWADCLVSLSQQITQELLEQGFDRERIVEIPNGVDTQRFTPVSAQEKARLRRELHLPTDGPLVIYVGRLHPQKGVETLIRAWQAVIQAQPRAYLLLAGQGPEHERPDRERLRQLAADLGLGASLHFLGHVEPVLPYLQAADVFVLPSFFEGLSIALLEAMACALAVVTTNIGGTREVVRPGVDGLMIEPGDVPALAAALGRVLGDAALAQKLGTEARSRVETQYAADLYIARYKALYIRLAGAAR